MQIATVIAKDTFKKTGIFWNIGCANMMKLSEVITRQTKAKVDGSEFKNTARKKSSDFTRKRKMLFEELIFLCCYRLKAVPKVHCGVFSQAWGSLF